MYADTKGTATYDFFFMFCFLTPSKSQRLTALGKYHSKATTGMYFYMDRQIQPPGIPMTPYKMPNLTFNRVIENLIHFEKTYIILKFCSNWPLLLAMTLLLKR